MPTKKRLALTAILVLLIPCYAQKPLGYLAERTAPDHDEEVRTPAPSERAVQGSFSDNAIQKAIGIGTRHKGAAIWKNIEKNHAVRINRLSFVDTVGKTVVFLTRRDLIALAASEAGRRHRILSVEEVKQWSNLGSTHVLLIAVASGLYVANIPKWQAPAVHMTITVDGREVQPLFESASERSETKLFPSQTGIVSRGGGVVTYTPLYESAVYDVTVPALGSRLISHLTPQGSPSR